MALKALAAAVLVTMLAAVPAAQAARPTAPATPPLTITGSSLPYTRTFNPFAPNPNTPYAFTTNGIYEPLYVVSNIVQKQIPWLATSYTWSKDLKTLTFTIRKGVRWSDGQPLTPKDVVFSLTMGQKNFAVNPAGLWGPAGLASSVTSAGDTVSIHFKKVNVTTFGAIVDSQPIVPEHIWARIPSKTWTTWTNPKPVGSGPFTQIKAVGSASYDVDRNPYYWQPLHYDAIRVVGYTDNNASNLDIEAGKVDWASAFIPDADKLCEGRGMGCHHFYSSKYIPVVLYLNDAKYPFSLADFRKAVSMAINRVALWNNAEYGYQPPANATGLNGMYANWMDKSVSNALATYNPTAANALLKRAGFTLKGGKLYDPKGNRVSFEINVVTGWTDWIAACQIIAQNLQALGMEVVVKPLQYGDYYGNHIAVGKFDAAMSWSCVGFTPYNLYDGWLGSENYKPIGQLATACNFERFTNAQMDQLFATFRATLDSGQQHALVDQMQRLFVQYLPVIPTTINALWYEYNPTHYTGFPTPSNYYVAGPVWVNPDDLVVLTRLRPTGH